MRTTVAVSSLLYGLALAGPVAIRQDDLGIDDYEAVATAAPNVAAPVGNDVPEATVVYNPTSVAAAVVAQVTDVDPAQATEDTSKIVNVNKRAAAYPAACTTRTSNGPSVRTPSDTPEAFQANPEFSQKATAAALAANVPKGYAVVTDFVNKQATAADSSYLTYVSSKLTDYDVNYCANFCNTLSGCNSFDIYYERVPQVVNNQTQVADSKLGCPGTADAPSVTLIKCAFYGMPIQASMATNVGQFAPGGSFRTVYAGSTAFKKSFAPTVDGFIGPVSFGNATINAPAPVIDHGFLRGETMTTTLPYDPSLCAASCNAQTAYNAKHGTFGGAACTFFDAFILYKDGANGVFRCAYYSIGYDASYATNTGQKRDGSLYTPANSNGYYLASASSGTSTA
ncbi:hypothetical protein GQ53DRAFT_849507 [Thozetella sp. PMI_491]|nr:hypothetical protein GQ53DRAFT_849507 [Thozetella sp. PMI_491]